MKQYVYNGILTDYLITRDGKVFSIKSNKYISQFKNKGGYINVHIYVNGKEIKRGVHCMVAETYIPNPENKATVNHKDGNKENNWDWNLEWATQSENNIHAVNNGLRKPASGEQVHFAVYNEKQVKKACKMMESDQYDLDEIANKTGIPEKTLSEIRAGKIWKDISKNYSFPNNPTKKSKIGLSKKQQKQIIKMIEQGKSNKEIYKKLKIEKSDKIGRMLSWHRGKLRKRMMKVQRPSNAQLLYGDYYDENGNWIEEVIISDMDKLEASRVAS